MAIPQSNSGWTGKPVWRTIADHLWPATVPRLLSKTAPFFAEAFFTPWDVKQYARMWGLSIPHPYILYRKQLTARMRGLNSAFPQPVQRFQADAILAEDRRLTGEFSWPLPGGFFLFTDGSGLFTDGSGLFTDGPGAPAIPITT